MIDFITISERFTRNGFEVAPKFKMIKSSDLMIRGGDFYAVWVEERGEWSTDEQDVIRIIDRELEQWAQDNRHRVGDNPILKYMWDADSGMIDKWHKYCQKQCRDNYVTLDETLVFSNTPVNKKDYASKRLSYPLEKGETPAWDKLVSTLYSEEERHKIEWAIGSIVSGDSKHIQKFLVFYGEGGTGKSTILNIIQQLFKGYYSVFDAKALGSASNVFALGAFSNNPLVAIQHDGDLSRIEDNTKINSLVSHEEMEINEKYKRTYINQLKCFLFMGTNKPVRITDSRSGIIRRLIDVQPSGKKLNKREYNQVVKQVEFELGAIAYRCRDVYLSDPDRYDDYIPTMMISASNDFFNFVADNYSVFLRENGVTLKRAWEMYNLYCEEAKVPYPMSKRGFQEELKTYFWDFEEEYDLEEGGVKRNYYSGFRADKFDTGRKKKKKKEEPKTDLIDFRDDVESIFDKECADCPAQYASDKETPIKKWEQVKTTLSDIDTSKLHYAKPRDERHIMIDFDLKDADGNKSLQRNIEEASKWPPTYAELSKSGCGVHLHYIYTGGDPNKLSRIYDENIEVKVFAGGSSLRRKLTKCNNLPIATISSGLPLKGADKVVDFDGLKSERMLRTMIKKNLNKEYHPATKPSIDYIKFLLDEAYDKGLKYDVSDMENAVFAFAAQSTNQSELCLKIVDKMKFKSEEFSEGDTSTDEMPMIFYDVEVFPNLLLINWKLAGEGNPVIRMINPKPSAVEDLMRYRLVGFNNRDYDNHILYARMMGYNNEQIYDLSQRIISRDKAISRAAKFREAYNISYTDVYDFSVKKQSLKKWEIELGIHHQELGLPWDQPVPEHLWIKVAEYCDNDVIATEAVFNKRKADFIARQIQVELVKAIHGITNVSVNDTTNTLSTKIIFGNNRKPQNEFNWRDLSKPVGSDQYEEYKEKFGADYKFRVFDADGLPLYHDYIPGEELPEGFSILPFFKGYTFEFGKSVYMDEEIGEGGRVYSNPGMWGDAWDGDIASQHPHSIEAERLFGPRYTKTFYDLVKARVAIKHKDFEEAGMLLNGALKPYLNEETADDLAQALKIVINSIYGLTSASFENPFRDNRNKDNIVAKRGALFMTLLKSEVEKRGYTVAHIKTDSIKIPDADQEIIDFVTAFGKEYGYTFETEANFEKFCLVNDAVYIAKYKEPLIDKKTGEEIWWTATGKQFAVPYVFKTLFSHKDIEFNDLCETFAVSKGELHLDMNESLADVSDYEKELDKIQNKYKKGKLSDTTFESMRAELEPKIEEGHDYNFVGRVGRFCPIKPGNGGGVLYRKADGKYYAAAGTTGYRWLESEVIKDGYEDIVDMTYFNNLVDDAIETISQYGDFEYFASDDPYVRKPKLPDFLVVPDGDFEELPFN